jgi:hypothetical protein
VNNGAAKPSAVAEPSDSTLTARNQHSIEPNCDSPRCSPDQPRGPRFAHDSLLEEAVMSELVSEAQIPC